MQLVVNTKSLVDATAWVTKTLDTKDDKAYIALVVDADGRGFLSHTNSLSHIKSELEIEKIELDDDEDEVKLALEGQYLKRFAAALRDHTAPLTFSKELNNPRTSLKVKRPGENYTIPLVEARVGATPSYEVIGSVSDGEYFDTVNRLAKLTDTVNSGTLPVLGTVDVKLDADEKTITVMGTDRYALGEISIPFVPSTSAEFYGEAPNLLIPSERAAMIAPSKGAVDNIELIFDEKTKKFGYVFPDGRIALFALANVDPLPYQMIKTKASVTEHSALVSAVELRNAIALISSLAYDESNIQLAISEKGLVVSNIHETNTARVTLHEVSDLEEPLIVLFTRSVLNEALNTVATNRFNLKWNSADEAFVIEPVFDDDSVADNVFLLAVPEHS